jgi:hypothetical protein
MKALKQRGRRAAGTAFIGQKVSDSIMDKQNHHASVIFPEQVALFRYFYKGYASRLKANGYQKKKGDKGIPGRKLQNCSGFNDYLHCIQQLFMIDIGFNGGQRAYTGYRMSSINNFAAVYHPVTNRPLGVWNVDAFIQKHTGANAEGVMQRSPYVMLDGGVNVGSVERFEQLCSHRCPKKLSAGTVVLEGQLFILPRMLVFCLTLH